MALVLWLYFMSNTLCLVHKTPSSLALCQASHIFPYSDQSLCYKDSSCHLTKSHLPSVLPKTQDTIPSSCRKEIKAVGTADVSLPGLIFHWTTLSPLLSSSHGLPSFFIQPSTTTWHCLLVLTPLGMITWFWTVDWPWEKNPRRYWFLACGDSLYSDNPTSSKSWALNLVRGEKRHTYLFLLPFLSYLFIHLFK